MSAQRRQQPVGELTSERLLEARQSRRPRSFLLVAEVERSDVGEESKRGGWSHLREDGGAHATDIGAAVASGNPWRE
jgi:hypothetical protein